MASIRKRGNSWAIQVYVGTVDGKKRFKTRTVKGTAQDAKKAAKQLEREVHLGFHPVERNDVETVASMLERWYAQKTKQTWSPTTARNTRSIINSHIKPALGHVDIDRLTLPAIETFVHSIDAAPSTVARIHGVLRACMGQAVRWGELAANPCIGVELPRQARREPPPPSKEELSLIIAALGTDDLRCAIHLAANTGVRRGQLVALRWRDINFDAAEVTFERNIVDAGGSLYEKESKSGRTITVSLGQGALAMLASRRVRAIEHALKYGKQIGPDCFVFSHDPACLEPWRPDYLTHAFDRARTGVGLKAVKLHHLRHWAATQMLSGGIDVATVAKRLGHSDPSVTLRRYAHVIPAADREAADLLDGLIG